MRVITEEMPPEEADQVVRIYMAWWWTWLYWPLTWLGVVLGLPLDEDRIVADFGKAIRTKQIK